MLTRNISRVHVFRFTRLSHLEKERTMIVLPSKGANLTFYVSTGKNSHWKDTVFVCRGIGPEGWIRKCRVASDSPFMNFCISKNIETRHLAARFGTTKAICISASIGGGFWRSTQGKLIKKYLLQHYKRYFLRKEEIEEINKQLNAPDKELLRGPDAVNARLREYKIKFGLRHKRYKELSELKRISALAQQSLFAPQRIERIENSVSQNAVNHHTFS